MKNRTKLEHIRWVICCLLVFGSTGAKSHVETPIQVIFPNQANIVPIWREDEKAKEIAIRTVHTDKQTSAHFVRLMGNEKPHYHDSHSLNVTVITGKATIHFKHKQIQLSPGDVIFIPSGTYHWAENMNTEASVVFATFSPAFLGKDVRLADEKN